MLTISPSDLSRLSPTTHRLSNGNSLYLFPSNALDLLKIDITFEAGAAYQPQFLCAATANTLLTEGTKRHTAKEIAEFLDYRGIAVDRDVDSYTSSLTFYTLRKYAPEVIELMHEIATEATYPSEECHLQLQKQHLQMSTNFQKTSYMARILWLEATYGKNHPMGRYALPDDALRLQPETVRAYFADRYAQGSEQIVVAGNIDDALVAQIDSLWGQHTAVDARRETFEVMPDDSPRRQRRVVSGAVQSSLRVGRLLPMRWDDPECGAMLVLNFILGGYFGSRLMSNIREDKGYTYGIGSQCAMLRGCMALSISTDVGSDVEQLALKEIYHELDRLCQEPVPADELALVRNSMIGDFLRSIDGIFERSDRFRMMLSTNIDERFRDHQLEAIQNVTPAQLQDLAQRLFQPDEMIEVVAGA